MAKYYIQITKSTLGYYYAVWNTSMNDPIIDQTYRPHSVERLQSAIKAAQTMKLVLLNGITESECIIWAGDDGEEHIRVETENDALQVILALT
jgi:hypothetical protein